MNFPSVTVAAHVAAAAGRACALRTHIITAFVRIHFQITSTQIGVTSFFFITTTNVSDHI